MKKHLTVTIDEQLLKKIDEERNMIKRSTFVNAKLQEIMNGD